MTPGQVGSAACLALAVGLAGCVELPRSTPLEEPIVLELEGEWVHPPSGIAFPELAAGFKRVVPEQYNEEGTDVGIGYARVWSRAHCNVSIFVYPAPLYPLHTELTEADHREELAAVREGKQDLETVRSTDSTALRGGEEIPIRTVEFAFRGGRDFFGRRVASFLTLIPLGQWRLKYRITTPVEHRDVALAAVEELVAELDLPPTGAPATTPAEAR